MTNANGAIIEDKIKMKTSLNIIGMFIKEKLRHKHPFYICVSCHKINFLSKKLFKLNSLKVQKIKIETKKSIQPGNTIYD